MSKQSQLERARTLEREAGRIRENLNVSKQGEILFQSPKNMWCDDEVVVEADGSGGATLMVVVGNYPADYNIMRQTHFTSEDDACEKAESLVR